MAIKCGIETLAAVDHLANLTALDLGSNRIRDLTPLAALTALKMLSLKCEYVPAHYTWVVTYDDLAPLAALTQLEALDIAGSSVTDLAPLRHLTKLRELKASECKITSVAPLAGLTHLQVLEVHCPRLRDISPLLGRRLRALTTLHIPRHVDCFGLETEFPSLCAVRHDYGRNNCLRGGHPWGATFADLERKRAQEPPLRVFDLGYTSDIRNLSVLARFKSLEELKLRYLPEPTDFKWLKRLPNLAKLSLPYTGVDSMNVVAKLPALRELSVKAVPTKGSLAPLQKLQKQLTVLRLAQYRDDRHLLALQRFTKLRTLALSRHRLSNMAFVAAMPLLEHLKAESDHCKLSLEPLKHCKKLQTLRVWAITGDLAPLAGLVELKALAVREGVLSLAPLRKLVNLEELRFFGDVVDDFTPLAKMAKLRVLDVIDAQVRDLRVLSTLPSLRELKLFGLKYANDLAALGKLTDVARHLLQPRRADV